MCMVKPTSFQMLRVSISYPNMLNHTELQVLSQTTELNEAWLHDLGKFTTPNTRFSFFIYENEAINNSGICLSLS